MLSSPQHSEREVTSEGNDTPSRAHGYDSKLEKYRARVRACERKLAQRKNEYNILKKKMDEVRRRFYEGRRNVINCDEELYLNVTEEGTERRNSRGHRVIMDDTDIELINQSQRPYRPYVLRLVNSGVALLMPARIRNGVHRPPRYFIFERITRKELFLYERATDMATQSGWHQAYFDSGKVYVQCTPNSTRRYQIRSYRDLNRLSARWTRRMNHLQRERAGSSSGVDDDNQSESD